MFVTMLFLTRRYLEVNFSWLEDLVIFCCHDLRSLFLNPGTTPRTVSNKEWWEETDKKFQAWPRTGGPPVVMNPITRQNFIVKSQDS